MVQSFNLPGILAFAKVLANPSLAVPHIIVQDVRCIDFAALKAAGISAIVFDKDNTLTAPYKDSVHPPFEEAWAECRRFFTADRLAVVSNSAGTPDDAGGVKAAAVEKALGVSVLRHEEKKPAGGHHASTHFRVPPTSIAVVGDRLLTDIVYGNLNGMLTIFASRVVTEDGDNPFAKVMRRFEWQLLARLKSWNVSATIHPAMGRIDRTSWPPGSL
ncbi:mitochondrial PGP phosphatase-domain-containing protein [Blyttiomyces helicus]|uniref:Mitochondrial PGP phosphatase-domain-containing protein n=1 Tax=Blyttiomyces helicus TaxID=388810 RepID=A0A4P9W361_9FUNG|nr:mitochondrial PGP phosphatase-domain-containing protein [Blyttiomyces helicus]|eukprot:RKO85653.1 mitochondrial PGP phosphatase-domain-containing protein [Blyttiomyces helicus]